VAALAGKFGRNRHRSRDGGHANFLLMRKFVSPAGLVQGHIVAIQTPDSAVHFQLRADSSLPKSRLRVAPFNI
jgi:hypothetical protein